MDSYMFHLNVGTHTVILLIVPILVVHYATTVFADWRIERNKENKLVRKIFRS